MTYNAREMLASAGYTSAPAKYGHSQETLNKLDNTPCVYCGQLVGREARGSSQCAPCIRRQIELDAQGLDPDHVDRMLVTEGRNRRPDSNG